MLTTAARRCVDGWPCMVGDLRGRKMRTGSKIENLSTTPYGESRELHFFLFNFLCNVNRAAYKCRAEITRSARAASGVTYVRSDHRFKKHLFGRHPSTCEMCAYIPGQT